MPSGLWRWLRSFVYAHVCLSVCLTQVNCTKTASNCRSHSLRTMTLGKGRCTLTCSVWVRYINSCNKCVAPPHLEAANVKRRRRGDNAGLQKSGGHKNLSLPYDFGGYGTTFTFFMRSMIHVWLLTKILNRKKC